MSKKNIDAQSAPARDVDEYLAKVPEEARATLEKLRKTIRAAAPKAVEIISYQIPTFKYHGMLVGFAAFKEHCGFYLMSTSLMKAHKAELEPYDTAKATIRFPAGKPLPAALVKKLVQLRIEENEARVTRRGGSPMGSTDKVSEFVAKLDHPFKAEVQAVRRIIMNANKQITEEIKWAAPTFSYKGYIVSFNLHATDCVHLVFHKGSRLGL